MSAISTSVRSSGPVIVLTYTHGGSEALTRILSASRTLACTSGTGVLPLCEGAMTTWHNVEGVATPSPLAVKSVRALASTIMTTIQAAAGASRWCETATASVASATTFSQIFPAATFLCVHRSLESLVAESMAAYPWGLGGSPFWPHSGPHPGNNVATVAAYWTAHTEPLLAFESQQPQSCLRVRHEELITRPTELGASLYAWLGLDRVDLAALRLPNEPEAAQAGEPRAARLAWLSDHIPSAQFSKLNDLHAELGYPELS